MDKTVGREGERWVRGGDQTVAGEAMSAQGGAGCKQTQTGGVRPCSCNEFRLLVVFAALKVLTAKS